MREDKQKRNNMEGNALKLKLNAAELKRALEQVESSGRQLEDLDVLLVVCDYDGPRLEGYEASSVSILDLREKPYLRIKAFSENKAVYK